MLELPKYKINPNIMQDIFGFLFLASLVALVIGLVKPKAFEKAIKNPSRKKVGLVWSLITLVMFFGVGLTADEDSLARVAEQTIQPNATQSNNEPESTQTPQLNEEDQIKAIVSDQLEGLNNMKKDKLRQVEVVSNDTSSWDVAIEFNASDNLSMNLRKSGIESQMSELYIALFQSGKDIQNVSITAYYPLVDEYGNENDRVVYMTKLEKPEVEKINWEANSSSLKLSILPQVWTTLSLHPEFK
jgi:hypothetical protein